MDDRMLTELLDTDSGLLVSLHIRSMDQNEAIKTVKRKITDIDSMKIDAQMCIRDSCFTGENLRKAAAQGKMEQLKRLLAGKEICL